MGLTLSIQGVDKTSAMLAAIKGQIPYATARALTKVAQHVKADIEAEIPKAFDNPTRWTLNALRIEPAKKNKLEAKVAIKDKAARGNPALSWLAPEVYGGARNDKRAEFALKTAKLLPQGMQAAPGKEAALNRFGNMTKAAIVKAAKGAKAAEAGEQQPGKTKYFILRRGNQPLGIAARFSKKRMGTVIAFVASGTYQQRLDYYGVGNKTIDKTYADEFNAALKQAIETAK